MPHLHSNPDISTHILTKRMTRFLNTTSCAYNISTHILTKRMTLTGYQHVPDRYFNSHPHEEDDDYSLDEITNRCISTHILTKRMTLCRYYLLSNSIISTHILTKRMTIQTDSSMPSWINFNSHPHEEDDLVYPVQFHFNNISTHILTKRMTFTRQMLSNTVKFQLTSSRRG